MIQVCHRGIKNLFISITRKMLAVRGAISVDRDRVQRLKECLGIVTTSQIFLEVFAKGRDP